MNYRYSYFIFLALLFASCSSKTDTDKNDAAGLYKPDFTFDKLSKEDAAVYAQKIKTFYDTSLIASGFNGAILAAKNGQILFEDYHGYADFSSKDTITPHTPFHLASISKTFTGMAVLKLQEENKLSVDDSLQKYFPAFPYGGVTIKMLLNHRSGLPNYLYFMDTLWDKSKKATNQDVMNVLINKKPAIQWPPDTHYNYCNTNFLLLALVIEKVTGKPFPDYMKQHVFLPLGMKDTYIFSIKDTARYVPTWSVTQPYPMDQYDCTYGDKNAYSTVRDLFAWDQALYRHTFLTKKSLDAAFTPMSNEKESMHNYGLAWHLFINNGDTIVYHNGKWHGTNTSFLRFVQDTATVIILGNKTNHNIYHGKQLSFIFSGKEDTTGLEE